MTVRGSNPCNAPRWPGHPERAQTAKAKHRQCGFYPNQANNPDDNAVDADDDNGVDDMEKCNPLSTCTLYAVDGYAMRIKRYRCSRSIMCVPVVGHRDYLGSRNLAR